MCKLRTPGPSRRLERLELLTKVNFEILEAAGDHLRRGEQLMLVRAFRRYLLEVDVAAEAKRGDA